MRICVIFNPTARGEKAKRFFAYLDSQSNHCSLKPTVSAGSARALASEAIREGFDTIVAAGGDGTVNEVLNGFGDEPIGFQNARLAVLPIGTVNVFAREVGIPLKIPNAWQTVLSGKETLIDLPKAEFQSDGKRCVRYFIQMAGSGWDAQAIQLVDWNLKKRFGQIAYMVAGWKALSQTPPTIEVTSTAERVKGQFVLVGNGRYYGGEIPVFHRANLQDGLLDICVFPRVNWFVLARYATGFFTHRILASGPEKYFQSKAITLTASVQTPLEFDGEYVGVLPVSCTILPKALRVVVP